MNTIEMLFDILRSELNGEKINAESYKDYDPKRLFAVFKAHDVTYFAIDALNKVDLLPKDEISAKYLKEKKLAFFRVMRIDSIITKVKSVLASEKIEYVPLKGSVMRPLYPDPLMRSSCDIDILIKEENLDKAIAALINAGFSFDGRIHFHDISLYFGEVHLELHFTVCDNMEDTDVLLKRVWDYVEPTDVEYEFKLKPEFFAFHHIAHMRRHFLHGGCGIKPFIDLYVMHSSGFYDEEKLLEFLNSVELTAFYNVIIKLLDVWFNKAEHSDITKKCEEYVIRGGVYGNYSNGATVERIRVGRVKSVFGSVFPSYKTMCIIYPKLKKRKLLLPFYYLKRICIKVFGKGRKETGKRLKGKIFQDKQQVCLVNELLLEMGIKKGKKK